MDVMKVGWRDGRPKRAGASLFRPLLRVSLFTCLPLMTTGYCECFLRHLKLLFQYNEMRYLEAAGSALVRRTSTICITYTLSLNIFAGQLDENR